MNIYHNCNGAGKEEDIDGCPKCPYCDGTGLTDDDHDVQILKKVSSVNLS